METKRLVQGRDNGEKNEFCHLDPWAGCSCHRKGSGRAKGRARTGLCRAVLDPAATTGGKGRERQRHQRPAALGGQIAQHGYQQCHRTPFRPVVVPVFWCRQSRQQGHRHFASSFLPLSPLTPILPFCCILGLLNRSIYWYSHALLPYCLSDLLLLL